MMLSTKGPQSLTSGYALGSLPALVFWSDQLLVHMFCHLGNVSYIIETAGVAKVSCCEVFNLLLYFVAT